jgi:hypothetical protein
VQIKIMVKGEGILKNNLTFGSLDDKNKLSP